MPTPAVLPPGRRLRVGIVGAGQLGTAVSVILAARPGVEVLGPSSRSAAVEVLEAGYDVVVIATTTRLRDVADDVGAAVAHGSNVVVSAEETAFPWAAEARIADELDAAARAAGVTILGCGVNPGLVFDSLVLTLLGACAAPLGIEVSRVVDLSGFGPTVLDRIGIGLEKAEFERRVAEGSVLGHAGFPQSISLVTDAVGLRLERIERQLEPVLDGPDGRSVGVRQTYTGLVEGRPWFVAHFVGHLDPVAAGLETVDRIAITTADGTLGCTLQPGIGAQQGSSAMIANSVERVVAAPQGWQTVATLPPAAPTLTPEENA